MSASTQAAPRPRTRCLSCGVECEQRRPWQNYCSPGCRRRDHEKRKLLSSRVVGSKEAESGPLVEAVTTDEVKFTTPDGRPRFQLRPCPDCGGHQFAWPIGSSKFACATCEPPSSAKAIAAFVLAP